MEYIAGRDREILRSLARKHLDLVHSPENEIILKKWDALAHGRREAPTVRLLFSNFTDEVITSRQQCTGEVARKIEYKLLNMSAGRELFDDDTPMVPRFDMPWDTWCEPFGSAPKVTKASGKDAKGYHLDPIVEDLERDMDKLRGGYFGVNREATMQYFDTVNEVIGDILPVELIMPALPGFLTYPLVCLMGMETYYYSMYDCPELLHEVMDMATTVYEKYYDFLEEEKLLLPTHGNSLVAMESFAYNSELPTENVERTTQCWGYLSSQETTAVAPEMYGEFVFPYQDRLAKRFGLLSYGCCERVDALWPDYLSKWKHLRKLSVSPFNNEDQVGEYLRGSNVVYYSKPRAEYVTNAGPLDEDAIKEYFKGVCRAASGCLLEVAQREVLTLGGNMEKGRQYVKIAKECVERWWKP